MKLNFKKSGSGKPLIILHGLFGSLDNWQTMAKTFSAHFTTYIVDLRNHGQSPRSKEWSYQAMADDLLELIESENLENLIVLGHSMGGKTAMLFAVQHPDKLSKLIVADIAPRKYVPHHQTILEALHTVDVENISSRKEAEERLSEHINDISTKQFLLKNLYWKDIDAKKLDWRFNLDAISENIEKIGIAIPDDSPVKDLPTLFIKGEKSEYITISDNNLIQKIFPKAEIETIKGAGHWLHAEKPEEFFDLVMEFAG
ncbi:MAG: alpha/beta fold hydrolase [Bacteroidetes bacterium]|nr:alpha/beta fold hydrolase [Bacteroidota bacterium]